MGGVEDDRVAEVAQDGQAAHVDDEIVVSEARAALREEDRFVPFRQDLVDDVLHVARRDELPLLDVDRLAGCGGGEQQVGLAAEKGRNLDDVEHLGGRIHFADLMDVGEHRHPHRLAHFAQDPESLHETRPTIAVDGGPVGLVVGRFVDERHAALGRDGGQALGRHEGVPLVLDGAGAADEDEGGASADRDGADRDRACGHGADEAGEERVRVPRPRAKLGVELPGDEVRVLRDLDDLDELLLRPDPRDPEPVLLEPVDVVVVDLVSVAVPLLDDPLSVQARGEASLAEHDWIEAQAHRPALIGDRALLGQEVDHVVGGARLELR